MCEEGFFLRRLSPSTIVRDAENLAQIFVHDPLLRWWQGASNYCFQKQMFISLLSKIQTNAHMLTAGTSEGAFAVFEILNNSRSCILLCYEILNLFIRHLQYSPLSCWVRLFTVCFVLASSYPSGRFLKIHYFMVAAGQRNKGFGAELLRKICLFAGQRNIPCYLETGSQSSKEYFEKRGWITVRVVQLPFKGPCIWLMQYAHD